jgi:hypothetical protein
MGALQTPERTIAMLLSVIAENSLSLSTLNLLMRTSKALNTASTDTRLLSVVLRNTPAMSKTAIRRLFVLPARVTLAFTLQPCFRGQLLTTPRCDAVKAFQLAVVVHTGVHRMARAFHTRARRSLAMKRMWQRKREESVERWIERRREIDQIHSDLAMVPQQAHITTDAETYYSAFGVIKRLSSVYACKRLKILQDAGLLRATANTFAQVANLDRTQPERMQHAEKLFVLRHNIAWEHYLYNYTNFDALCDSVQDVLTETNHVEFLFPLPLRWPWITPAAASYSARIDVAGIRGMYEEWHAAHQLLYTAGP